MLKYSSLWGNDSRNVIQKSLFLETALSVWSVLLQEEESKVLSNTQQTKNFTSYLAMKITLGVTCTYYWYKVFRQ